MKKTLALILALAVVLSLGVAAFAAGSQEDAPAAEPYTGPVYKAFDENGNPVGKLFINDLKVFSVGEAGKLDAADKEAFLAAYENAKNVEGKAVKYFFWISVKLPAGAAYVEYPITCSGKNVEMTLNGKEVELVNVSGNDYIAKVTESGYAAVFCDAE